ncbi:MAG TPA: hypothetical protein PKC34_07510 [Pseudomonadales bacterium]|nr:hypothetical protein [Pseudomonadales bacterium]HMW15378.1 hypothetical protein [Pseudomonadales bacterium]HMW83582.1 hypothetical protein [Pseudomonadales bacterium]HMY97280.1 hypothetical protein [Pseudomonadales bacterium]HMZ71070.1 hypothetical protein [Pseudomonadales bacterium]
MLDQPIRHPQQQDTPGEQQRQHERRQFFQKKIEWLKSTCLSELNGQESELATQQQQNAEIRPDLIDLDHRHGNDQDFLNGVRAREPASPCAALHVQPRRAKGTAYAP